MKSSAYRARKLSGLLRKMKSVEPPQMPGENDPVAVLVMSFLIWESTTEKALAGYVRLMQNVVDFNDLRVCLPHESMGILGPRYPMVNERCERLRAVLRDLYLREHAVSFDRLQDVGKRDVKKFLDTLDGVVPYVANRVAVLSFDTHAIPVDEQLRHLFVEAEVADESMEIPELSNWLANQIRAGDGADVHHRLQAWVDTKIRRGTRRKSSGTGRQTKRRSSSRSRTSVGVKAAAR